MKKILALLPMAIVAVISTSCGKSEKKLLYSGTAFSLFGNRVEQGGNRAVALSDDAIISNYKSPANTFFDPLISFKLSINGRDNEAPAGCDHQALLIPGSDGKVTVRCAFGEKDAPVKENRGTKAVTPPNTPVRFEVDLKKVISAFEKDGFYTDFSGNRIFKSDFRGVWIAGGIVPLSWDFENLQGRNDLKLEDADGDGIYTCDLVFNVYDPAKHTQNKWSLSKDLSAYPSLRTPFPLVNALYKMSLEEMILDIRPDSAFMAGKEWNGVWTRDISYSIILSLAGIEPAVARNSLMHKVRDGLIIQDTGTGGSWPVSTDRQIWSLAAWEVFKSTGDTAWLRQAYDIIERSMERDLMAAFNTSSGLFYGESSFLDWRKQTYPLWMEPADIYLSHNLGTNAVFCGTLEALGKMGEELGIENSYHDRALALRDSINCHLWNEKMGFYGQYLYGHYNYSLSPRSELLGEALCILFDIPDQKQKEKLLASLPVLEFGVPCIYPQIPGIPPYHNNAIWPFVQSYMTWAGAVSGNSAVVEHGIASVFRQAALFLTNKENMVAGSGDFNGTQINSDYQLWSVAGDLAIIFRVIFGIQYETDGIHFKPFIPEKYDGDYHLSGLKYRDAVLDITVSNNGDGIARFEIDGEVTTAAVAPANLRGRHTIKIIMNGRNSKSRINLTSNLFAPDTPVPVIEGEEVNWPAIKDAYEYRIYANGVHIATTHDTVYDLSKTGKGEYQIMAVDASSIESFLSRPVQSGMYDDATVVEAERFAVMSYREAFGYTGRGFVEITRENPDFRFSIIVPEEGDYIIEFRYANGNGPVNTDNKCAQRSLFKGEKYTGNVVFPQRGNDEWSDWGLSNPLRVHLEKGKNNLGLLFLEHNNNMNGSVNGFLLDNIRYFPAGHVSRK